MISQANQDRLLSSPQMICVDDSAPSDNPSPLSYRTRKIVGFEGKQIVEPTCPSSSTNRKKSDGMKSRRTVTFDTDVRVRHVRSLNDYSQSRYSAVYYSRKEFKEIRDQRQREARILSELHQNEMTTVRDGGSSMTLDIRSSGLWVADLCARGIEYEAYPEIKAKKIGRRLISKTAVFFEQDYQENNGFVDEMCLAEVYSKYAKEAADAAALVAMQDEIEAQLLHMQIE